MNIQDTVSPDIIPDKEIITRVLGGEKEMYALLVRRYNQRLYRVGMSIINDDAEVEDVMQVSYIKAYANLPKFEFKSSFSTWLTRILINECLLRLKKRKQSLSMSNELINNEQNPSRSETPLGQMLNNELRAALEKAIKELPEKYRTVFVMREIENINITETGECLGLTEVNVKVRLNRAKAMLRNSLNHLYKKEDLLHFHLSRCDKMTDAVMKGIGSF